MKTAKTLRLLLSFALICCLAACEKDDETLSSIKDVTLEGDATTLTIDMNKTNWSIEYIEDINGPALDNLPKSLEGLGTLIFRWGSIVRDKENALTVNVNDNFDKEDRGIVITIKMKEGFYKEDITIRQKQCTNFYQIESIDYMLEEGDGIKEVSNRIWGITYIDKSHDPGVTTKMTFYPILNEDVNYSFSHIGYFEQNSISSEGDNHKVNMPKGIENGKIVFDKEKRIYTNWGMYYNREQGEPREVDLISWKRNIYSGEIYYKRLQVSYTMMLTRTGSDSKKTVKGKLMKEFPYGCSAVRNEVSDLQPED